MKLKKLWKLYPIVIFVGFIYFFSKKSSLERQQFLKMKLNDYVIEKKNNWSGGRSYDYITNNGIVITLLKTDNSIQIGDSIVKKNNSNIFCIHRKINNNYQFYKKHRIYN